MSHRLWLLSALIVAPVAVSGCGKKDAAPDPATQALRIGEVHLGRTIDADKRITAETDKFKPAETVYLSVVTNGTAPAATVAVRWTYEDGQVVDTGSQTIAPTGAAVTEFHVSKPSGWPKGKYHVAVSLDGAQTQTKDFTVSD